MTDAPARARFVVRGVVQGVLFRASAAQEAAARDITGRIWNRDDGAVELIAEGDRAALDDFERWLARGPRHARVERVERADLAGPRRFTEFDVSDGPPSGGASS